MNKLICLSASLMILTGCSSIPWIGPLLETKPAQHVEETIIEESVEEAAVLCGEDVHVEFDIDPINDPKCMNCSFHCPKEPFIVERDSIPSSIAVSQP